MAPVPRRSRIVLATVLAALAVPAILVFVVSPHGIPYRLDLDVYRAGGRAVLDGAPLYGGYFHVGATRLPFTYPPAAALAFTPVALLPGPLADLLFTLVSLAALVASTAVVARALAGESGRRPWSPDRWPPGPWTLGLAALPLAVWLWPVHSTLKLGQINLVLMALVLADLLPVRTPWPRGLLVGLAAALKLTPAVFGLTFLMRRQWRPAATCAATGIGATALVWVLLPGDSGQYWTRTLSDPSRIGDLMFASNQSWRGMIARFVGNPEQARIWTVLAALTLIAVVVAMARQLAAGAVVAAVCSNALLGLLVSPVSWAHHWVWVVPMAMAGLAGWYWAGWRGAGRRPGLVVGLCVLAVSTVASMHNYFPAGDGAERGWTVAMKIAGSEFTWLGLAWLVVGIARPRWCSPAPGRTGAPPG